MTIVLDQSAREDSLSYCKTVYIISCCFSITLFLSWTLFATEHYQQQDKLKEVESCLLHLDVTNLDIHQVSVA